MVLEIASTTKYRLPVGVLCIALLLGGCSDRAVVVHTDEDGILPPPNPTPVHVEIKKPESILSGNKSWLGSQLLPSTTWYVQYQNGKCLGYSQFTVAASGSQGSSLLRLTKRDVLEVPATVDSPTQRREILLESLEATNGTFHNYTETTSIGSVVTETTANLQRGNLMLSKKTADGKTSSSNLAWPEGTWGPLGVISILKQAQLEPDEFLEAQVFVPPLEKVVKVELKSKKRDPMPLPGGLVSELLLVETLFISEGKSALTKNWVNEKGEIVKSISPGGFTMIQSSKDEVERIDSSLRAALLLNSKIPVTATEQQLSTARVTFSIESASFDPYGKLSGKVNQKVKSLSAREAALTVDRVIPSEPIPEGSVQDEPNESHRAKFTADSFQLKKFLSEFPESPEDALSTASKLTEHVFRQLKKTPLSRQFSTPTQAIVTGAGDCNAHAILLTAALRERGIPARTSTGLRIIKEPQTDRLFAIYHMWCEAWVGDRWIPLDPFAGSIGVGVDHIKFSESSLDESNLVGVMLSVLECMNQLTIVVKQP